ncbi:MAG: hypothetical protein RRA35_06715, partial [Desulfomonilia bacterium]|nr:hypothetical protein [Desulfomonilia bacterium]
INQSFVAKLSDRRFIKSSVSDIISEQEYQQLVEQKLAVHEKEKIAQQEAARGEGDQSKEPGQTQSKRRRSRNRSAKKKRKNQP